MPGEMFSLRLVERDGLTHLKVGGSICMWTSEWLASELRALIDDGVPGIVVDMSEVDVIDVAGIRVLTQARRAAVEVGTHLVLGPTSVAARRTMEVTRSWDALADPIGVDLVTTAVWDPEPA